MKLLKVFSFSGIVDQLRPMLKHFDYSYSSEVETVKAANKFFRSSKIFFTYKNFINFQVLSSITDLAAIWRDIYYIEDLFEFEVFRFSYYACFR